MPSPETPAPADDAVRAAALTHLLTLYPAWLADEELGRSLGTTDDAIGRAVRDLAAEGLVHRRQGFVLPTRAAVSCAKLVGELSA